MARSAGTVRARKPARSSVERSAQWMSSRTTSSGARATTSATRSCTWPNRRALEPSAARAVRVPAPAPGSSAASSGGAPATSRSHARSPSARDRSRSASVTARNGAVPAVSSTHVPTATRPPAARAWAAISATRRVLPTPASPPTSTTEASPPAAAANAASSTAISAARPTKDRLARRCIGPIIPGEREVAQYVIAAARRTSSTRCAGLWARLASPPLSAHRWRPHEVPSRSARGDRRARPCHSRRRAADRPHTRVRPPHRRPLPPTRRAAAQRRGS